MNTTTVTIKRKENIRSDKTKNIKPKSSVKPTVISTAKPVKQSAPKNTKKYENHEKPMRYQEKPAKYEHHDKPVRYEHHDKPVKYNKKKPSAPNTPQQRRTILPVKARRVDLRKETLTMTEEAEIDSDDSSDMKSGYPYRQSTTVYAGPTFNNAPAPSALPIPAFIPADNLLSLELSEIQRSLRSMLKI
ncbi:hypothetical protein BDB01DRAFT_807390 [Pilobolus umbonatus]|nr:hypothetical protein BDB01DRAFT_807390 [Pilobolus umbonatus]